MFENIVNFFKGLGKNKNNANTKDAAKERLHLVLMQDRANVSADFLALMKQEIIEVIKKYIDVDENAIDVKLTNKSNEDGTTGAPVLYANIPIMSVKEEAKEEARKIKKENEENKAAEEKEAGDNEVGTGDSVDPKEESEDKEEETDTSVEEKPEEVTENKEEQEEKEVSQEEVDAQAEEVIEKAEEIVEEMQENSEEEGQEEEEAETK